MWSRKNEMCRECGTTKRKHRAVGLCGYCYDKKVRTLNPQYAREKARRWAKNNPEKLKNSYIYNHGAEKNRNSKLKRVYGISENDYQDMLNKQEYKCKICGLEKEAYKEKNFRIDHDHKTGKIRGLLCHQCNIGLGAFKDNKTILISAINYLIINKKIAH